MANATALIQKTRRLLGDWPELDTLTASVSAGGASLTVGDGTRYHAQMLLEIEQEVLRATAAGGATSVNVQRAIRGSIAASHASGAEVLMAPRFFSVEILDELNNALDACFPRIYRPVSLDFENLDSDTYEYVLPNMSGINVPIPYVSEVQVEQPGDIRFVRRMQFEVVRGEEPYLKFRTPLTSGGTIRINGFGHFTHLSALTDTLDPFFPGHAESLLPLYAAASLLDSGENRRVRQETGAIDNREQATAVGASQRQASKLQQRFYTQLERWAMSPPAKAIKTLS